MKLSTSIASVTRKTASERAKAVQHTSDNAKKKAALKRAKDRGKQ